MQGHQPPERKLHQVKLSPGHGVEECCSQHKCATIKYGTLKTPLSKDLGRGATNSGTKNMNKLDNVLRPISSQGISAQDKIDIMQQSVAKCPKVSISCKGIQISSLLHSGSEVSLFCNYYFKEHLLPKIETPTGEKSDAHICSNSW